MAKLPIKLPTWATNTFDDGEGRPNKDEPGDTKKADGWAFGEKPPFNWFNYWMNVVHRWFDYFNDEVDQLSVRQFDPTSPDMRVIVSKGRVDVGGELLEIAETTLGPLTAPTTNDRIDLVVVTKTDGSLSVVTGTEAASPVRPATTPDEMVLAQVYLTPSHTEIVNDDISDLRPAWADGFGSTFKVKQSDTSRANTTTVTDDPELSGFVLEANTTYYVEAFLLQDAGAIAAGFKQVFQTSLAFASQRRSYLLHETGGAPSSNVESFNGNFDGTEIGYAVGTLAPQPQRLVGVITTGASQTTVDYQWAQNTSDAAASVLKAGSWIRFTKLY